MCGSGGGTSSKQIVLPPDNPLLSIRETYYVVAQLILCGVMVGP